MADVITNALETYTKHAQLLLISSISFVIAILIPIFAAFPTYTAMGGIYLRTASIFSNLTVLNTAVIVVSVFFSLLFISFAMVAINIIVKHSRTYAKIRQEVFRGLEKYTSRVFVVLLILETIIILANALSFAVTNSTLWSGALTAIVGLIISPFFFYAPASIIIDEKNTPRAMVASFRFFFKRFDYVILWLAISIVLITVFDFVFVAIGNAAPTIAYLLQIVELIIVTVILLPFLIVLQSESYMKRFAMLKH
jgi:hypothetical protein